jgi:hypothetical protein
VGVLNAASLALPPDIISLLPGVLQTLASPTLIAPSAGATTEILDLMITSGTSAGPPVDVDLLGLQITTSNIDAHLLAQTGDGNLLGNLLFNAANLLNPGNSATLLSLLAQLADLTFIVPGQPSPNPGSPIPGDFNSNGVVDAADYVVWRKLVSAETTQSSQSTIFASSNLAAEDYDVWKAHFGMTASSHGAASSSSLPNSQIENAAITERAFAFPTVDHRQANSSQEIGTTHPASRHIVETAFDQIAAQPSTSSKTLNRASEGRSTKFSFDRLSNLDMRRDALLTAYQASLPASQRDGLHFETAGGKELDHIFDEFETVTLAEELLREDPTHAFTML